MKKLILSILVLFSVSLSAQTTPIVTYKITTTGLSNGLVIPNPFYVHVNSLTAEVSATGFNLLSYAVSSTDAGGSVKVVNDAVKQLTVYSLTIAEVDTMTLDEMVESRIKQSLINAYGSANVIKVE